MAYLIFKKTRREAESQRRESLAKRGLSTGQYRGTAGSVEEAHDTQRALERDGDTFDRLWEVSGESQDAKQADQDFKLRHGISPDAWEPLHSSSTKHE
jgi:hypothetical protein